MDRVLQRAGKQVTLVSDGWTNIRGESIINYIAVLRGSSIFLKSIATGKDRHTGEYLADGLVQTIDELGPKNVGCVTTDNASALKKSLELVVEKVPHVLTL